MDLLESVRTRQAEIAAVWGDLTLGTYPPASTVLFAKEKDPFRNPVGATVRRSAAVLLAGLLGEASGEDVQIALDAVVRLRAVQDFTPGQAVGFVFLLREALVRTLGPALAAAGPEQERELGARIDALALAAFDVFTACRQRLFELRANEAKARVHSLLRRAGMVEDDVAGGAEAASEDVATKGGCPV
jgi:hypothetical protein